MFVYHSNFVIIQDLKLKAYKIYFSVAPFFPFCFHHFFFSSPLQHLLFTHVSVFFFLFVFFFSFLLMCASFRTFIDISTIWWQMEIVPHFLFLFLLEFQEKSRNYQNALIQLHMQWYLILELFHVILFLSIVGRFKFITDGVGTASLVVFQYSLTI